MLLRLFKLLCAVLVASMGVMGCGGGASPSTGAPTGLTATPGENSVTLKWDMVPGVEYWLFVAPTSAAPTSVSDMHPWFSVGPVILKVSSPYTYSGLTNGTSYTFSVNGRVDGKAGGPGATPVAAIPRFAGSSWTANSAVAGAPTLRTLVTGTSYLIAGTGGNIFTGTDASTWTQQVSGTTADLNGGLYLSQYVLVGNAGTLLKSTDGVTWTTVSSGTTKNLNAIATNGAGLYVIVGEAGTILTSSDTVTWTAATSTGTTANLNAVIYTGLSGAPWLAAGAGGVMVQSTDTLTWTPVASGTSADLKGMINGYNSTSLQFNVVVVGANGTILSSTDGTTFNTQTISGAGTLNAVTFSTQFVVVGSGGKIYYSLDSVSWLPADQVPTGFNTDLYTVRHGTFSYVAAGANGITLQSK